ncbi:MAG TPA: FmdB family zinc ribbon protein [Ktedonosporobacter sp.]|nr:FmdB family zinc ribbon protein [Ktedonosporobacter sp.]
MPRYEFRCDHCGPFECWRSLDQVSTPMVCPTCQVTARRVYTAPGLVKTPTAIARALYRSEKSAHEPDVLRRERPEPKEEQPAQVFYQSHGRPWLLEH